MTAEPEGSGLPSLISRRTLLAGMLTVVAAPALAPRARASGESRQGGTASPDIQSLVPPARPFRQFPREHHTTTYTGIGTVVLGGYYNGALASVQIYDGEKWREGPPLLTARFHHAAAAFGDGLIVVGGISAAGDLLSDAELFDGGQWRRLPAMRIPRSQAAAVPWNGGILVTGGMRFAPLTSVEEFDGALWQPVASLTIPRYGHSAAIVHGAAQVEGGFNLARLAVAELFDGVRWTRA
jgi:hypothetical protein